MSLVLLNIASDRIQERRYDRPNYPDPSLYSLSSYLKKYDIECNVIDAKLRRLNLKETIKILESINPSAIGFTSFTHEIERVADAANAIKDKFPKAKFIIGGPHANAPPKRVLSEFPVFDISIFGEGEQALIGLIKNNFEDLSRIKSIAYRRGMKIYLERLENVRLKSE